MKPRNLKEKHIVELSGRLCPLTTPQMQWALNSTINHYGYRLKSGMCTCMKCGHEWLETRNGICLCPECGTQIEIKDTKERVIRDKSYFNVITTMEDYQVVRMFLMMVEMRKGMKAKPAFLEIGSYWIDSKGNTTVIGSSGRKTQQKVEPGCYIKKTDMTTQHPKDNVTAIGVIKNLPYDKISEIAAKTKVDYKAKKLRGVDMMVDCIFAMLSSSQVSQRIISIKNGIPLMTDTNGTSDSKRTVVVHSSFSERLTRINIDFFKEAYALICSKYLKYVPDAVLDDMQIIRVDSTMVAETSNKLVEGFSTGMTKNTSSDRRQLKYTMAYNGLNVVAANVFTERTYSADNAPISKTVAQCLRKRAGMSNGYVFDRGLKDVDDFKCIAKLTKQNRAFFVGRLNLNRCTQPVETMLPEDSVLADNEVVVTADDKGYLRAKQSDKWDTSCLYRIIRVRFKTPRPESPRNTRRHARHYDDEMVLITNNFEKDAIEIVQYYRRRWDIEVFFKFLKQDLSFSHFISTNVHGIQVMLYMTLIVALLVKIYSIAHNMGPRIAKQAIMTELIRYQTETIKRLEAQVKSMKSEVNNLKIKILSLQTSSDH